LQIKSENSKFSKNSQKNIWRSVHQYESTSVVRFSRWCPDSPEIAVKLAKFETLNQKLGVFDRATFGEIAFWVPWRMAFGVGWWWSQHQLVTEAVEFGLLGFRNPNYHRRRRALEEAAPTSLWRGGLGGDVGGHGVACDGRTARNIVVKGHGFG
jgi:hypothetical protein